MKEFKNMESQSVFGDVKMFKIAQFLSSSLQDHILIMDVGISSYVKDNVAQVEDILKSYPMPSILEEEK